jgi:hypothetical protein
VTSLIFNLLHDAPPYESIDDIIIELREIERILLEARDRRVIFVTAYRVFTQELQLRISVNAGTHEFIDVTWVERCALAFAELYRSALMIFEANEVIPDVWRLSFETAVKNKGTMILDLLLGMNAHINRDLPHALFQLRDLIGTDEQRDLRRQDYTAINRVLSSAVDPIQQKISELYLPVLNIFDDILGPLDEQLTDFSFEKARANSWANGMALINARNEIELALRKSSIEDQSEVLGHLMLVPSEAFPWLNGLLRHLERDGKWSNIL